MSAAAELLREADVRDVIDAVLSGFLQVEPRAVLSSAEAHVLDPDGCITGCVTIGGAFSGAVVLVAPEGFVRRAAATMFDSLAAGVTEDMVRDALAELTNVIGGNVKSLLSSLLDRHCHLSLPLVAHGVLSLPGASLVHELWCRCGVDVLRVSVFEAATAALPRVRAVPSEPAP